MVMLDSELDWLIMVTEICRWARQAKTRAATPGTPAMPLPSMETTDWPGTALMALTGCEPGV